MVQRQFCASFQSLNQSKASNPYDGVYVRFIDHKTSWNLARILTYILGKKNQVQANLCQTLLFLHQLTHKYDDRLFIELQVQYMKIPSSNLGRTCCVQKLFRTLRTISIFVHNMFSPCSELGIFMYETFNSMNNLPSYCGLVDAKIRASDKDLPVST